MIERYSTDQMLLRNMSTGDVGAFNHLFNTRWDKIYSTAFILTKSHELAEDITQEVFLKIWQTRSNLASIDNLDSFLFIMARNLTYNRMKRIKTVDAYLNYLLHKPTENIVGVDTITEYKELNTCINQGIEQLPPQQQKAFKLSREKGLTHEQIAIEMNITRESVKGYIVRSIAFLRKYLKEHAMALVYALITERFL